MLQKANDARMASGVRQSNIRLIGPAEPAARPYKPNLPLNLVIGALGGFVLAIGCVMLQEQNTSVLHSPGEAGSVSGTAGTRSHTERWCVEALCVAGFLQLEQRKAPRRKGGAGTAVFVPVGVVPERRWRPSSRRLVMASILTSSCSRVRGRWKARQRWSAISVSPLPKPAGRRAVNRRRHAPSASFTGSSIKPTVGV